MHKKITEESNKKKCFPRASKGTDSEVKFSQAELDYVKWFQAKHNMSFDEAFYCVTGFALVEGAA